ncbi:MAG: NAD synthetase [Rhodospirillaceae bacterium]|nr:NAD synthetase [Rhodospirillaceae bacterium]
MSATTSHDTPIRRMARRFFEHKMALISAAVLLMLSLLSFAAPLVEVALGIDHTHVDLYKRFSGPSWNHPFGTDELGRDLFVRLLYGGRVSLMVAIIAALIAAIIGTAIGIISGYYGGWLDRLLMRINDGFIALPLLPLLIVLAAVDLEKIGIPKEIAQSEDISIYRIIVIIALVGWNTVARLVRAETLTLRELEFVHAAMALGASPTRIMTRHVLPNAISPIIVALTLSVGTIILFESILSFLGLGIQPPVASWGNMLSNAQDLIWSAPQLAIWPGIMIFVTVIAFNFLGDGLQDALDPRVLR